ncbi:hypothetical protein [Knoellia aerolata]|uniref:Conjugal transfer protein TrbL n=1 Tax=Knoellia aerolata DSM 18566 TaxID=1385519 RepID=A0A0A0JTT8_9MICO|nr:hypothetical protein [Knoellia aerolata]KGN40840.1 hypothetical protein N801_11040 [Knoellia aerolata DSM 18566]
MSCEGPNKLNPLCLIQGSVNDAAAGAATSAFSHIAGYFGEASVKATTWLWEQIDEATTLDLTSPNLLREMAITGAIAAVLCVGLFAIQLIRAVLRQEPGGLQRALSGLVTATLGTALALAATRVLLAAVDALSAGVVQATMDTNVAGLGAKLTVARLTSQSNPAVVLLLSLVTLAAVVIVWAAMLARKLMLLVAAVLAPIAFAGAAADFSRAWVRRWIEFVVAMIASKLLLVLILSIGVFVLEGAGQAGDGATQQATQLIGGSLVLLMGGLAPWVSIKMFSFAGESIHAAHAAASQTGTGARSVAAAPQKVAAIRATGRALLPAMAATGGAGAAAGLAAGGRQMAQRRPGPLENAPHPGHQQAAHGRGPSNRSAGAVESRGPAAASAATNATTPAEFTLREPPRGGASGSGPPTHTTPPASGPQPTSPSQGPHQPPQKN